MIESQRALLREYPHQYLSIGITEDGEPKRSVWIPWERTGNAHNMRIPSIYLTSQDLTDESIWAELERFHINGCYIFCPLEDYSFLYRLTELWDLNIYKGGALRDLRFLHSMKGWFQLHVEDAVLENLEDLFPVWPRKDIHSYCVCLSGCTVGDISALARQDLRLSELVILMPQGSNDRERWKAVRCGKYSYFEYRT
jgi:hypothetical protein